MDHSTLLRGKSALVTGGDRGIGKGIATALARAGARVAVNYHSEPELAAATVGELGALGADAFAVRADVRSSAEVTEMIDQVAERFGRLDVLVNNAGVQTWKPLLDVTEDEWDLVVDTNLKGSFLCTQAGARHMAARGGGSIVQIGSGCNKVPFPSLVAYTASKGGIEMLTRVAAIELGPFGIRVNCVAPGAVEIERTREESPDYAARWSAITPLGRVATPADVGRAVVFLASDESAFVTGQTLWVDGGLFSQPRWAYDDADRVAPAEATRAAPGSAATPRPRARSESTPT
jgi:NAD(P)-dependent dehydrogenase (short-subunit alcohol dehydrogenase family)